MEQGSLQFGQDLDELIAAIRDGNGPWKLEWEGKEVLRLLSMHRGMKNPIPLRDIAAQTKFSPREVKALIRSLVIDFGLPVGASRSDPSGYYLAETAAERLAAAQIYVREIRKLAVRVKALVGTHDFVELFGQMRLEETG